MKRLEKHRKWLQIIPLAALLIGLVLMAFGQQRIRQAGSVQQIPQQFVGQYRYADGPWQPVGDMKELSALKGDVHLRGHLVQPMASGSYLTYYLDHIGAKILINGVPYREDILFEIENYGMDVQPAMCGSGWEWTRMGSGLSPDDTVEIYLKNPHRFGNENAYRDFLSNLGGSMNAKEQLQENIAGHERGLQILGIILLITAIMLLSAALTAAVLRIPMGDGLVKYGLLALFVGGYILLDTVGLNLWSENRFFNTYTRQLCMMFSAYWLALCALDQLTEKRLTVGKWATAALAAANSVLILLSFAGVCLLYDTLFWWVCAQLAVTAVLLVCAACEWMLGVNSVLTGMYVMVFTAIVLDIFGVFSSIYSHATLTKLTVLILFVLYFVRTATKVIANQQAAVRAEKLEKELQENRISLMLSQIQPHFLYNVLGTIRGLCREDPEQAREAMGDFAKYLRGNMNALTNNRTIHFTSELQHIDTYLRLEKMRMGQRLNVVYDVEEKDFCIPPLTVQPLVENAVKHGIFNKPEGGTVRLSSRDLGETVEICVCDDGIGFDPEAPLPEDEEHAHVGLQNVRSRLQQMLDGSMTVESAPGAGTVITIRMKKNWNEEEL